MWRLNEKAGIVATLVAVAIGMITVGGRSADTAGRARILGIAYVKIRVTDLKKAHAFYGGVLGLEKGTTRNGNAATASYVVNGNQRVELVNTEPGATGSYLAEIGFATDDVAKMRTWLTMKGVPASEIRKWADGTRYFETQDAENKKILFVEQKWEAGKGGGPEAVGRKLLHAGFVVKDWKAENRFYEDVLGFRLYWKGGFQDDGLDWYEIQVPDGTDWIEYMLNIPATADHKELGVQNHFSLGVGSANAAAQTLRARGFEDFEGPEIGRDGKNALDAYDPDGTRVELMEFVPTGRVCCSEYGGTQPEP